MKISIDNKDFKEGSINIHDHQLVIDWKNLSIVSSGRVWFDCFGAHLLDLDFSGPDVLNQYNR